MSTSARAGSVNSTACSTVTPGISPTVIGAGVEPGEHLAVHLGEELVDARPADEPGRAVAVGRCRGGHDPVGQGAVRAHDLGDEVDDVHPEAVDAALHPAAHHPVHRRPDLRVLPVQVGLLAGEQVQVVLAGRRVELPGGPGEERHPVRRLRARLPRLHPRARRAPEVPVALLAAQVRARLDEPRVLVAGVVDDEVHDQLDAAVVQRRDQLVDVGQAAEGGVDVLVVADVVAGVVLRRRVDRGEPDDVHPEPGEVVDPVDDPAQVADPVAVGVGEAAGIDLIDHRGTPPRRVGHRRSLRSGERRAWHNSGSLTRWVGERSTYWYETKTMSGLTCIVCVGSSMGRSSSMKFFQPQ